ncbi:MAG TPA: NADH-ubiquinone oxidoreductase-F iron-sulfur binding region domain-containing protein [Terriglobales bacterium]|nr:NADH-ubiquinone oxidoreductase-F iron-sulfur binding region domain-containing protein [Terriglobales bacterium]
MRDGSLPPAETIYRGEGAVYEELRAVQDALGHIPTDQLNRIAERNNLPIREIHAVASFYPHFRLTPPKTKVEVRVCDDMTCHLRDSTGYQARLKDMLRGRPDSDVMFLPVSCLGRCEGGPALAINGHIFDSLSDVQASSLVQDAILGQPIKPQLARVSPVKFIADPYESEDQHYGVVRRLVQDQKFPEVIAELKAGGLRGMGGAGFPAHIKWDLVRKTPSAEKYVVCNADESEPGTFKDRFIMESAPHLVVEGTIIGGLTIGARRGFIYVRHEYERCVERLQAEIENCYSQGLLGRNILGSGIDFELEVFVSPGGYICGEVSAMLEAIQGNRAEPRDKPPQTGTHGLWHKPTLASNVETFTIAVTILAKGAEWYLSHGKNGSTGLKFVGISGHVKDPGPFEVPMGTTYRELIEMAGGMLHGRKLIGFAPSGPSSGYLPASMIDLPIEWSALSKVGSMIGSAAVIICGEGACMLDMALNAVRFFRNESCGKCVPCRVGTQKMVDILTHWTQSGFSPDQLPLLEDLSSVLKVASICGLGQIAPAPIASVMKHFPDLMHQHLHEKTCEAGVCFRGVQA